MTPDNDRKPTLAGELDRTRWDYSPSKDRRFLLAPLSRIFESIAWGSKPRPDEPDRENDSAEDVESQSVESLDR